MLKGHQTWVFESKPVIIASATVGGPFEAQGAISEDFDILHSDIWLGQDSFEKAEKKLLEEAATKAIDKAGLIRVFHLEHSFGHHKSAEVIRLIQIGDDDAAAGAGGMDHFAISHVDAYMTDPPAAPAEKEEVAGQHLGKVHLAGDGLAPLNLLAAAPGQIHHEVLADILDKPGTISS